MTETNNPGRPFFRATPAGRMLTLLGLACLLTGCGGEGVGTEETSRQLEAAGRYMDSLNFNHAAGIYELSYAQLEASDPRWAEAAFGYGLSLWNMTPPNAQSIGRAQGIFEEISANVPDTDWDRAARLNLARIHMLRDYPGDEEDPVAAIPLLEALTRDGGPIRHEALVRLVECYRMQFADPEAQARARDLLTEWLGEHPDNPLAALMWEQVGWLELEVFENRKAAIGAFMEAEEIGFADPSKKGTLLWLLAQLVREEGDPRRAANYYAKLIEEAPSSGRAYEAQQALLDIRDTVPGMESLEIPDISLFMGQ